MNNNRTPDLFSTARSNPFTPLADRLRPQRLEQFVGQQHLLGEGKPLYQAIRDGKLHSMIFWGPPGTGKTTLARMIANHCEANFMTISAVLSGVKEIRAAIDEARQSQQLYQRATVLFVDEVHRFNKSQQDAFLPHVEDGTITFIGATTENPSFEINNALLSRARVYVLKALSEDDLIAILRHAIDVIQTDLGSELDVPDTVITRLAEVADGDARRALNLLDIASDLSVEQGGRRVINASILADILQQSLRRFDKQGEAFYDQISALHKSVRGSAPDAALYWLVRMLDGGCDPLYIARRVVRMASEDIGNADPRALQLALNAWDVQERLGHPEGELSLAQTVVYLACAPKSNAVYTAYHRARQVVETSNSAEVPIHLRNAPTKLMKELGYGKTYRYAHDEPHAYAAGENYFPDGVEDMEFYQPTERGLEAKIKERLSFLRELDKKNNRS